MEQGYLFKSLQTTNKPFILCALFLVISPECRQTAFAVYFSHFTNDTNNLV